jgi:hypothetical protein
MTAQYELLKLMFKYDDSKVHNYLLVLISKFFLKIHFFPNMYHILNPYKITWDEMILKNKIESSWFKNTNYLLWFHFKSSLSYV